MHNAYGTTISVSTKIIEGSEKTIIMLPSGTKLKIYNALF